MDLPRVKYALPSPVTFCDEVMGSTDEGRAVCVVCLDCSKVFDLVSSERYGLNR